MKSVSVHKDFFKQIRKHTEEEIGRFFLALASDIDGEKCPKLPGTLEMLKELIDDQNNRFRRKQSDNGKRGGRPEEENTETQKSQKSQKSQTEIKKPKKPSENKKAKKASVSVTVPDTVSVTVSDTVSDTVDLSSDELVQIVDDFHAICPDMPKVIALSDKRKRALRELAKKGIDFKLLFTKAAESDFLTGRDGKWPGCNFDWLLKYDNALKTVEGAYINKSGKSPPGNQFTGYTQEGRYDLEELERKALEKTLGG